VTMAERMGLCSSKTMRSGVGNRAATIQQMLLLFTPKSLRPLCIELSCAACRGIADRHGPFSWVEVPLSLAGAWTSA